MIDAFLLGMMLNLEKCFILSDSYRIDCLFVIMFCGS